MNKNIFDLIQREAKENTHFTTFDLTTVEASTEETLSVAFGFIRFDLLLIQIGSVVFYLGCCYVSK